MRKNQKTDQEMLDCFEVEPMIEDEVVLIEEEPEVGREPPAGYEDMLYEDTRDREFEKHQSDRVIGARELPESMVCGRAKRRSVGSG